MKEKQKKLHRTLLACFWVNITFWIITLLGVLLIKGPGFIGSGKNVVFEQYSILFTIAAIPLTLKVFHSQYKKIKLLDEAIFLKKYRDSFLLRIAILDAAIILNLAGLLSFGSQNAVYMIIITIIALFFCYPDKGAITNRLDNDTNENLNNE